MATVSSCTYPYQKGEYSLHFALLKAWRVTITFVCAVCSSGK